MPTNYIGRHDGYQGVDIAHTPAALPQLRDASYTMQPSWMVNDVRASSMNPPVGTQWLRESGQGSELDRRLVIAISCGVKSTKAQGQFDSQVYEAA